ncbi:hypothetical protein L207DRAFT_167981 [Hyaloscypha variabilis F]|uniref:CFEM domain-containing protein n=1 Tax=Hyaloscypha variabilis (strain UAMH 11265 / GT02V1 / F) TaxID=1149755 RepID=A0A2J6R3W8_HYAVF|nr:hypothetical protein L207DRAFT_167981 [Hyaloscypha variabilis F]
MHLPSISHVLARAAPLLAPRQSLSFSDYPACAQSCLSYLSGSTNCITPGITATEANYCLCNDIPYLSAVAKCTYNNCGVSILDEMAQISVSNCASTGTPSALTVQEMIDEGLPSSVSSATSSTVARSESTTSAAAPESTQTASIIVNGNGNTVGTSSGGSNCVDCNKSGGISQSDKIALGIGIGFGIPSVIIGIVGIW